MAAGILLVKESGGIIEAMDPSVSPLVSGDVVASNEPIFNRFAKIVRNEA
jgi:myo-inositol-1(or 4)-monophosphatase